jgi:hypothetical protein
MLQTRFAGYTTFALLALGLAGCGGDDKPPASPAGGAQCPPGQYFDGQMCQTPGAPLAGQPTATPTATAPPTATTPPVPPVATSAPGTPATPVDASAVVPLLTPLIQQYAPGGKPVGAAIAGNFQQGQTLEGQVQMNPGKCYTIIGVASPTVQNLDIELVPVMPIPGLASPVMAADQTTGPTAVVGASPNCFKWALQIGAPMKVVVRVSAGQGVAGAQVYEK